MAQQGGAPSALPAFMPVDRAASAADTTDSAARALSRSVPAMATGQSRRSLFQVVRQQTLTDTLGRFVGDKNTQEVTKAFYQSAANVFVLLVGLIVISLYYVFSAFLRPLLWAVLCGVFLFPLKRRGAHVLNTRLRLMQANGIPLWLGTLMMPVLFLQWASRQSETVARKRWRSVVAMATFLGGVYALNHFPVFVALQRSLDGLNAVSDFMKAIRSYGYLVWSIIGAYLLAVAFFWHSAMRSTMRRLSPLAWGVLLLYLASLVPNYRLAVFLLVTALCVVGVLAGRPDGHDDADGEESADGGDSAQSSDNTDGAPKSPKHSGRLSPTTRMLGAVWRKKVQRRRSVIAEYLGPQLEHSGGYFFAVAWCCVALKLYECPSLLWLLLVPVTLIAVRLACSSAVTITIARKFSFEGPRHTVGTWLHSRRDALIPPPLRALLRFVRQGDKKVTSMLLSYTDKFVTMLLILMLVVTVSAIAFFVAVQFQRESAHIAGQAGVLGEHIKEKYPDIKAMWEGGENSTGMLQTMTEQLHMQGRSWLLSVVKSSIPIRDKEVEQHILSAWDMLYLSWTNKTSDTNINATLLNTEGWTSSASSQSWQEIGQQNVGAVKKLLGSTWLVLKGNANLVLAVLTAVLSTLLDSSTAVLNFVVSIVIFLTSVMYLLAASDREYIPLTWLSGLIPPSSDSQAQATTSISTAVQGVFGALLKMVTFYSLFTYFTHSLFGFEVIVFPAVVAALFAAIPLLGSYWVALPGTLYLGAVTGSWLYALLLLGLHFMAYNVVDTAIYTEIKGGGHPYLTGLAVAGGLYIFGLEGAVIGPILLCCGLVAMEIYRSLLKTDINTTDTATG